MRGARANRMAPFCSASWRIMRFPSNPCRLFAELIQTVSPSFADRKIKINSVWFFRRQIFAMVGGERMGSVAARRDFGLFDEGSAHARQQTSLISWDKKNLSHGPSRRQSFLRDPCLFKGKWERWVDLEGSCQDRAKQFCRSPEQLGA